MFLPIGDQPNPRGTAPVNTSLLILNVVVFVLITLPLSRQPLDPTAPGAREYVLTISKATRTNPYELLSSASAYDLFVFEHGFKPLAPSGADLIGSMFLHAGWMHLIGNMLFLWIFGDNVEGRLGRAGYLVAYLATGVAATLFHGLVMESSPLPLIGASGAISGVLGFYFVWFPRNSVRVLLWFYFFVDIVLIPARWVLGFYLIVENLLPFVLDSGGEAVAYGAHIGGFLAGALLARLGDEWSQRGTIDRWLSAPEQREPSNAAPSHRPSLADPIEPRRAPDWGPDDARGGRTVEPIEPIEPVEQLRQAFSSGRTDLALRVYFRMQPRERALLDAEEVLRLAEWLVREGFPDVALASLRQYLATNSRDPRLASIHLAAGWIALHDLHQPASAYQHLASALRLDPPPETQEQITRAVQEIERLQKFPVKRTPRG